MAPTCSQTFLLLGIFESAFGANNVIPLFLYFDLIRSRETLVIILRKLCNPILSQPTFLNADCSSRWAEKCLQHYMVIGESTS